MLAFAGLDYVVDVCVGHSKDLLHRLDSRYEGKGDLRFRVVFMDQKGSRYIADSEMSKKVLDVQKSFGRRKILWTSKFNTSKQILDVQKLFWTSNNLFDVQIL